MIKETKESIFQEWEERNHKKEQQEAAEEIENSIDQIETWLSNLEAAGTERSGTFKLHEDDKEAIVDQLEYIRELVAKL